MAVTRQLVSRAHSCRMDEPEFQLRRWALHLDDYNVFLELAKGNKNEDNSWDWSNAIRLELADSDIDSLVTMIREFTKTVRRQAYTQQQSQAEPSVIMLNPFIVTRNNKYIISLWCTINVNTTQDGQRRASRETEIRIYPFDGNWDTVKSLQQDAYAKRNYTGVTPVYGFKISNLTRIRGLFVYEDMEQLETLMASLETCVLRDSAAFIDHFRKISEENQNGKPTQQASSSANVGYNNKIPSSGEPDMPNVTETDFPF